MTASYEVFFYDHDGVPVTLLEGWQYMEFTQRVSSHWNSLVRIDLSYKDPRVEFLRDVLMRDYIMEIYRRDWAGAPKDAVKVYEGLHRTTVDQVLASGLVSFSLYSVGYTRLLERRIVIPPVGSETVNYSGVAETIMKQFVDDQAVSPVDADRIITGLAIEADAATGGNAEYSARYTILGTVIERLAEQGEVDFGIVRPDGWDRGTFEFQVRPTWGTDKRVGNADGNPPMIFDLFHDNIEIPIYSVNGNDEITYVYIGGQGQGIDRTIQELSSGAPVTASPWNRIERFVDARHEPNADGLDTHGQAYLNDWALRQVYTFNLRETDGTRWIRDWELGDLITSRYFDLEFEQKIIAVTSKVVTTQEGRIENISAEFEHV